MVPMTVILLTVSKVAVLVSSHRPGHLTIPKPITNLNPCSILSGCFPPNMWRTRPVRTVDFCVADAVVRTRLDP